MPKVSVKERMLSYLSKEDKKHRRLTFSTEQARKRFKVRNVSARIADLRDDGYPIYTNVVTRKDGRRERVYRLGSAPNVSTDKVRGRLTGRLARTA